MTTTHTGQAGDRRGRHPDGRLVASASRPAEPAGRDDGLRVARRAEDQARAGAAARLTVTPVLFTVMFTYMFGGAIAGRHGEYLRLHPPGHPRDVRCCSPPCTPASAINTDLYKGRDRPVPAPSRSGGPRRSWARSWATRSATWSPRSSWWPSGFALGFRPDGGGRRAWPPRWACRRVQLRAGLGVHGRRAADALAERGAERRLHGAVPAHVPGATSSWSPRRCPDALEAVVEANPISHLATASRSLMAGSPDGSEITSCCS